MFQPVIRYKFWDYFPEILRSRRLPDESIKPPAISNNSLAPSLNYTYNITGVKFDGICLKQDIFILSAR